MPSRKGVAGFLFKVYGVSVMSLDIEKLIADYYEFVPAFVETKDIITSESIVAYIGDRMLLNED